MSETTVTKKNFEEEITNSSIPVLVDFWASWCGPCRMLAPTIAEIANERDDVKVGKINVDEEPELAERYGIMSIPTLLLFKDGKVVSKSVGLVSKTAIERLINI